MYHSLFAYSQKEILLLMKYINITYKHTCAHAEYIFDLGHVYKIPETKLHKTHTDSLCISLYLTHTQTYTLCIFTSLVACHDTVNGK